MSNDYILHQFGGPSLTIFLLRPHFFLLGNIARTEDIDIMRQCTFQCKILPIQIDQRRRGRPRHTWAVELLKVSASMIDEANLNTFIMVKRQWEIK